MVISKDDWQAWRYGRVGQAFFASVERNVAQLKEQVGSGSASRSTADETAMIYANQCGFSKGAEAFIEHIPEEVDIED